MTTIEPKSAELMILGFARDFVFDYLHSGVSSFLKAFWIVVSIFCNVTLSQAAEDWLNIKVGSTAEIRNVSEFPPSLLWAFINAGRSTSASNRPICDVYWPDPYAKIYRPKTQLHLVEIVCPVEHFSLSQPIRLDGEKLVPVPLPVGDPKSGFELVYSDLRGFGIDAKSGNVHTGSFDFCDVAAPDENEACDYSIVTYSLHDSIEFFPVEKRTYNYSGKLRRVDWSLGNKFNKSILKETAR